MSATPNELSQSNDHYWHNLTGFFSISSEVCNIGIVIGIVNLFFPEIMTIAYGVFGFLAHYMDAAIYLFKSLIRATKALGRHVFKIKFEEDVDKHTNTQTALDLLALALFITTIILLTAVSNPIAATVAWVIAWVGLGIVGYSDYYLPKKKLQQNLSKIKLALVSLVETLLNSSKSPESPEDQAKSDAEIKNGNSEIPNIDKLWNELTLSLSTYETTNKSFILYRFLMVGIGALLICSSATVFTTGTTCLVLGIIAKVASAYLAIIAICRLTNWFKITCRTKTEPSDDTLSKCIEDVKDNTTTSTIILNLFSRKKQLDLTFDDVSVAAAQLAQQ